MSNRWEHLDTNITSLRDAMSRLIDQSMVFGGRGEAAGGESQSPAQTVPVNVFEAEEIVMIMAPMAGVQEEDIEITVRGNTLLIEARERGDLKPESGKRYLRHEWRYGPYRRSVELPYAVDATSAEATLGDGVLTVRVQKAETERTRRIQVKGTGAGAGTQSSSGQVGSGQSSGGSQQSAGSSEGAHEGLRQGGSSATTNAQGETTLRPNTGTNS